MPLVAPEDSEHAASDIRKFLIRKMQKMSSEDSENAKNVLGDSEKCRKCPRKIKHPSICDQGHTWFIHFSLITRRRRQSSSSVCHVDMQPISAAVCM